MFYSLKLKKLIPMIVKIAMILLFCTLLTIFPKGASEGAKKGLEYCLELLVPSLFPFMVLSSYIVRSGVSSILGEMFSPIMRFLFRLDGSTAPTVIMSFIGGFPVGARGIAGMYETKQISLNQARRMSLFCVGAGPAFLITAVGTVLLGNTKLGIILLVSQLISGLILGIISRFFYPEKSIKEKNKPKDTISQQNAFIKACTDGSKGIISLSALVILFQTFIGIIEQSGAERFIEKIFSSMGLSCSKIILPSILEVTGACNVIAEGTFPLYILSAVIAFGGFCVYLQIWGILSEIQPNKLLFVLFRVFAAILNGFCTYIITLFYKPVSNVFNSFSERASPNAATHLTGGIAILVLSMLFLLSISVKKRAK